MASASPDEAWPRIAVVGAGAVGGYFGGMLARAGAPVIFIGRERQVAALRSKGLTIESEGSTETIPVSASTDARSVADANVVLFCVKSTDTEGAARSLAPHLTKEMMLVSLQNGVDNVEKIRATTGVDAVPAVVYVGAEATAPARVKHTARGDLILGAPDALDAIDNRPALVALFTRAGIPVTVSANVKGDLWMKLIQNCAYNALSAIGRARYGLLVRSPWTRDLMKRVVDEVVAVGQARGVRFPEGDLVAATWKLGEGMVHTISSTAQDLGRGKPTEIDSLNGYVSRLGDELGVPTPVNRTLHALVKFLEEGPT